MAACARATAAAVAAAALSLTPTMKTSAGVCIGIYTCESSIPPAAARASDVDKVARVGAREAAALLLPPG